MTKLTVDKETGLAPVLFLVSHAQYVRGDIAGFAVPVAENLIAAKVATADLKADLGQAAAAAPSADVVAQIADKDAEIAALKAQLAEAAKKGAPPKQGDAGGAGASSVPGGAA